MIEKLKWDEQPEDAAKEVQNLIDQLVDAVNKLETMAKNTNTVLKSLVEENNIHEKQIDKLQETATISKMEKVEPADNSEKANCQENVQDKFAEQRRWIGKLCWYKLCEGDTWKVGRLEKIQGTGYPFVFDGLCYKICEPVKPDDDIIFKGE